MKDKEKKVADGRNGDHEEQGIIVSIESQTNQGLMHNECEQVGGQNQIKKVDPGSADL
ncbi:MAG: hypothetical protein WC819_02515 [Parcubacteria group bacterium]